MAVEIVAKINAPVDTIIINGDLEISATHIVAMLQAQTRPVNRRILADILTFLTKLSIKARGRK